MERGRKAGHRRFLRVGTRGRSAPFFFAPKRIVFIGDGGSPSPVAIATVMGCRGGGVSLALRSLFFLPDRRCEVWLSAGCALGGGRRSAFDAAEETLEGLRSDEARSRRCLFHLRQH